ncbi:GNAT domain-containing protein [Rhodocollybia butyracea]|uniref:GNAT domain-containing protein n=1 Tax=Rhodocollybia butyracea TaxID=206335 RepID=A0A9P5PVN0_9AGAR|nr:GNAT domain-containing protein [Rhodocollybia butyracea]
MLCNKNTVLVGANVVLVPYQVSHVPRYHAWMEDEELRRLTASEPLTLEQEYEMQQKWQTDEDKLTFIIVAREADVYIPDSTQVAPTDPRVSSLPMVGDVNIFFSGNVGTSDVTISGDQEFSAEAEIMIAESSCRRRGYATEALRLVFQYVTGCPAAYFTEHPRTQAETQHNQVKMPHTIPPRSLITRISDTNTPSIKLFENLGFRVTKHVKVFDEVEMRWGATM